MSDDQLLDRAAMAGWKWFENEPSPMLYSRGENFTGWYDGSSFHHCKPEQKVETLRPEPGRGFDHDLECHECKKPIWLHWLKHAETRLIEAGECFNCNIWLERIRAGADGIIVNRDGELWRYTVGGATKPGPHNGCGGSWFTIRMFSGAEIRTCDLWCQGIIPERFRDRLPANAEFVGAAAGTKMTA